MKKALRFLLVTLFIIGGTQTWAESISTADGLKTALEGNDATITLGEGTITLSAASGSMTATDVFTVARTVTIQGAGKDKTFINGHFKISPTSGNIIVIFKDLTITANNEKAANGIIGIPKQTDESKTADVQLENCDIKYGSIKGAAASVGVRMEAVGAKLTLTNTNIDVYYYGLGLRNKNQNITITGGTITARAAIMTSANGLTTSDGTLESAGTTLTVSNATLLERTISKGNEESYAVVVFQEKYNGVTANFNNCTIKVIDAIAGLNEKEPATPANEQMAALNLRSFGNQITFTGCAIEATAVKNETTLATDANAVFALGWDTQALTGDKSKHRLNTITVDGGTITGNTTDADQKLVASGRMAMTRTYDQFTIKSGTTINGQMLSADKEYTPESGLIYYAYKGASNSTDLVAVIDVVQAGDVIYTEMTKEAVLAAINTANKYASFDISFSFHCKNGEILSSAAGGNGDFYLASAGTANTYEIAYDVPAPFTMAAIEKTALAGTIGLFANGNAVTVKPGTTTGHFIATAGGASTKELDGSKYTLFGGSKDASVASASITVQDGVTIKHVVGGGYGSASATSADVNGNIEIKIGAATVTQYLVEGGALYSKVSGKVTTTLTGTTNNKWIIPCMEGGVATGTAYDAYENSACTVDETELKISGGTYSYIGITGGNGNHVYTQKGTATIENATLSGLFGSGSNGRGDEATATLTGCTFVKPANYPAEIAAINRGGMGKVNYTFNNCTFPETTTDLYCYLGATYDWTDGNAQPTGIISDGITDVSFTFNGGTNGIIL